MTLFEFLNDWGSIVSMVFVVALNFFALKFGLKKVEEDMTELKKETEKTIDKIQEQVRENERQSVELRVLITQLVSDIGYIKEAVFDIKKDLRKK